jgi:hypothetical protein
MILHTTGRDGRACVDTGTISGRLRDSAHTTGLRDPRHLCVPGLSLGGPLREFCTQQLQGREHLCCAGNCLWSPLREFCTQQAERGRQTLLGTIFELACVDCTQRRGEIKKCEFFFAIQSYQINCTPRSTELTGLKMIASSQRTRDLDGQARGRNCRRQQAGRQGRYIGIQNILFMI